MTIAPSPEVRPIQRYEQPTTEYNKYMELAKVSELLIRSNYCNIRNEADALWIVVTGHSLGIDPIASLRGINVIQGKPELSSDMMMAVALKHPDCLVFRTVEMTDDYAVVEVQRRGWKNSVRYDYTYAEAQAAGLTNKHNWKKHRRDMLKARAISRAARAAFPDALMGVYIEGELDEAPSGPASTVQDTHVYESASVQNTATPRELAEELRDMIGTATYDPRKMGDFERHVCSSIGVNRLEEASVNALNKMLNKFAGMSKEERKKAVESAPISYEEQPDMPDEIEGPGKTQRKLSAKEQHDKARARWFAMIGEIVDAGHINEAQGEAFRALLKEKAGVESFAEVSPELIHKWLDRFDGLGIEDRAKKIISAIP